VPLPLRDASFTILLGSCSVRARRLVEAQLQPGHPAQESSGQRHGQSASGFAAWCCRTPRCCRTTWCVWLVVETDPVYHPQKQLQLLTASGAFQESVVIGGPSNNNSGHEFPVHVLAVSKNVSNTFRGYLRDSDTSKRWVGVLRPADSRVLATLKVIRDDSASI
jgi:hypothetical protein